jgi:hypothetical protein
VLTRRADLAAKLYFDPDEAIRVHDHAD